MNQELLLAAGSAVALGLAAGFSPGPLFALVLAQTLRYGAAEGMKVALSPLLTDLPIVTGSILLVGQLVRFETVLGLLAVIGSLYLAFLGLENLTGSPGSELAPAIRPRSILRGVLANLLNPQPYLFWLTVGAPYVVRLYDESPSASVLYLVLFYFTLVGSKMALAWLTGRSRRFLGGRLHRMTLRVLGILLLALAVMMLGTSRPFWTWLLKQLPSSLGYLPHDMRVMSVATEAGPRCLNA